tara:strand:+ start:4320 stop:5219 length:900 start_codon:yes stop_codon:yes gene_type:complete
MNTIDDTIWNERGWESVTLSSFNQYKEITTKADTISKQTTWIYKATLLDIWENIRGVKTFYKSLDNSFRQNIDELFAKGNKVWSNAEWLQEYYAPADCSLADHLLTRMSAMHYMLEELRNGGKINDPISCCWYPDWYMPGIPAERQKVELQKIKKLYKSSVGRFFMHPGTTRIYLAGVYKEEVDVIITDYSNGELYNLFPQPEKLKHINDAKEFDVTGRTLYFCYSGSKSPSLNKGDIISPRTHIKDKYRELYDDTVRTKLQSPGNKVPPEFYEKKNNEILVNGKVVLRCSNNLWELVL